MPTVASIVSAPWRYWVVFMDWQTGHFDAVPNGLRHLYGTLALFAVASITVRLVATGQVGLEFGVAEVFEFAAIVLVVWLAWVLATCLLCVPHFFLDDPDEVASSGLACDRWVAIVAIWTAFAGFLGSIAVGVFGVRGMVPLSILSATFLPQLFRWSSHEWGFCTHPVFAVWTLLVGYAVAWLPVVLGFAFGRWLNGLLLGVA